MSIINKKVIISLLFVFMVVSAFSYVDTWRVERNIDDMMRMVDFSGVFANERELVRLTDECLHILRDPRSDGSYRYADWSKSSYGDSNMNKMKVELGSGRFQEIKENFTNLHAVELETPKKWGFFHGNDPIYVKSIRVEYTTLKGERKVLRTAVERWFNSKDKRVFPLEEIAKDAQVIVLAACKDGEKNSCALYVNSHKAELRDSFSNPYYSEVRDLKDFKNSLNTMNKDEAMRKLHEIGQKFGVSYNYVDTELVNRLERIVRGINNTSYAINALRDISFSLQGENYDNTVVRGIDRAIQLLERNQYGDSREAAKILNRVIDQLNSNF